MVTPQNCCKTWSQVQNLCSLESSQHCGFTFSSCSSGQMLWGQKSVKLQKQMCCKMCKSGAAQAGIPRLLSLQITISTSASARLGLFWWILTDFCIWGREYTEFWFQQIKLSQRNQGQIKNTHCEVHQEWLGVHPGVNFCHLVSPWKSKTLPAVKVSRCVGFTTSKGRQNLLEGHKNRNAARENFALPDIFQHLLRSSL